jgi:hypothetical protein
MELSSWEAVSSSATQEFPNILWNTEIYYRVHKSPPLAPILSQINPVHATTFCFSKINFILSSHLRLGIPSDPFPSDFPTKIL